MPETLQWVDEFQKAGNLEGIASRLEFHGGLYVDDIVRNSGLSHQTVRKHLQTLQAQGRAEQTAGEHWRFIGD